MAVKDTLVAGSVPVTGGNDAASGLAVTCPTSSANPSSAPVRADSKATSWRAATWAEMMVASPTVSIAVTTKSANSDTRTLPSSS